MNDIEVLENFINNELERDKLELDIRCGGFKMGQIYKITELDPAIENLLKERQADKDRIKELEEQVKMLDEAYTGAIKESKKWFNIAHQSIPKSLVIEKIIQDKANLNKSVNANLNKIYKARIEFGQELLGEKQDLQINKEG